MSQAVSNCVVHHLFAYSTVVIILSSFVVLLNCSYFDPLGVGLREWLRGPSCWMRLNHDTVPGGATNQSAFFWSVFFICKKTVVEARGHCDAVQAHLMG